MDASPSQHSASPSEILRQVRSAPQLGRPIHLEIGTPPPRAPHPHWHGLWGPDCCRQGKRSGMPLYGHCVYGRKGELGVLLPCTLKSFLLVEKYRGRLFFNTQNHHASSQDTNSSLHRRTRARCHAGHQARCPRAGAPGGGDPGQVGVYGVLVSLYLLPFLIPQRSFHVQDSWSVYMSAS